MRLLLAEDERELSDALCAILKHNHYSVDPVYDGQDALDYLRHGQYDGAILDIMMPKIDGLSVLHRVREEGNGGSHFAPYGKISGGGPYPRIGYGRRRLSGETLCHGRAVGTHSRHDTQADRNGHQCTAIWGLVSESGGFHTVRTHWRAAVGQQRISDFGALMENPNRVISTDQFLSRIWGYDADAELGVVWVYISGLRKKLHAVGSTVEIKANRGVGYLLASRTKGAGP